MLVVGGRPVWQHPSLLKRVATVLKRSSSRIQQLGRLHQWVMRAQAWDQFQDQMEQRAMIQQRTEARNANLIIAQHVMQKAMQACLS